MNKTTEALKLAEEALDELRYANDTEIAKTKYYKALAAIREALADHVPDATKMVAEPDGRCKECMAYNGHIDGCRKSEQTDEKGRPLTFWGGKAEPVKRPQNCGTGYCSCIECIYGKDGCVADDEQCNDGCLARESTIADALKLADELDSEFCQGRISNHNGRKAAQMLRMLVDSPVQPVVDMRTPEGCDYCKHPLFAGTKCNNCGRGTLAEPVKQEPVAWLIPGSITGDKKLAEANGDYATPLYAAPVRTKDLTDEQKQLARFYQVETLSELVAAMEKHIEKLQARIEYQPVYLRTPREG